MTLAAKCIVNTGLRRQVILLTIHFIAEAILPTEQDGASISIISVSGIDNKAFN